jgi:hypothetical protein
MDRGLGSPQSQSGRGGEEKNSQPLPRLDNTTPLSHPGSYMMMMMMMMMMIIISSPRPINYSKSTRYKQNRCSQTPNGIQDPYSRSYCSFRF